MLFRSKGKTLVENDDIDLAAKNLNSRIWFLPKTDGVYRIVATSFQQKGRGDYEIILREYSPPLEQRKLKQPDRDDDPPRGGER